MDKLKTLSIGYLILGILCIPASFVTPVTAFFVISKHGSAPGSEQSVIIFLIVISIFCLLGSLGFTFCIFLVAHGLRKQKWKTFCLVMAAILSPCIPLGTILGIYTLLTLNKPEIKELYNPQRIRIDCLTNDKGEP